MNLRNIAPLFLVILLLSCNKDKAKLVITDFSRSKTITLKPYKIIPYAMINIRVKGYTNDTIKIKGKRNSLPFMKLSGQIDTLWQTDYYGEGERTFTFDPYKATDGELEIDFNL